MAGKRYSKMELHALSSLIETHGHIVYDNNFDIEGEFYDLTGSRRASGSLYMCAWRIEKGYYAHLGI